MPLCLLLRGLRWEPVVEEAWARFAGSIVQEVGAGGCWHRLAWESLL